jgi:hypothetical protein
LRVVTGVEVVGFFLVGIVKSFIHRLHRFSQKSFYAS